MNHIRVDRALVLDLEMTCWADDSPPPGETAEIIQIGLAEADLRAGTLLRSTGELVRPMRSIVSAYCSELTGLTATRLQREGSPLIEVLHRLAKSWPLRTRPVFVWGDDAEVLRAAAGRSGAIANAHDLHAVFRALAQMNPAGHPGSGSGISVPDALDALGLTFEGRRHDAEHDARNTARILLALGSRVWNR